mmetsp:Transcript_11306/g.17785  ORF Transcript_11306/g.17785 Transcript_11306/m.17785 type:complete len:89 (+) Transcript_11306:212-478(+)
MGIEELKPLSQAPSYEEIEGMGLRTIHLVYVVFAFMWLIVCALALQRRIAGGPGQGIVGLLEEVEALKMAGYPVEEVEREWAESQHED